MALLNSTLEHDIWSRTNVSDRIVFWTKRGRIPVTVHLVKLAVGVDSVDHLRRLQAGRQRALAGRQVVDGFTRRKPRRAADLLDGGSIYWVIRGAIAVRQQVVGLEDDVDDAEVSVCRLVLDCELVETRSCPRRAFQGWRYLAPSDAPLDLGTESLVGCLGVEPIPAQMVRDLRDIGLL